MDRVSITFRLPPEDKEALRIVADCLGVSVGALVWTVVRGALEGALQPAEDPVEPWLPDYDVRPMTGHERRER